MTEDIKKNNFYSVIKKPLGVVLVIVGLLLHLIPLFPASWIIVLGLELLGIRILIQDKIKAWLSARKKNTPPLI
jgi:hypothetical protein